MLKLKRNPEYMNATLGELWWNDTYICQSLELPWLDNKSNISCIPKGNYLMGRTFSPHFNKITWEVFDVDPRTGIRFHTANYTRDLRGCVAPVTSFKFSSGTVMGLNSGAALKLVDEKLKGMYRVNFTIY